MEADEGQAAYDVFMNLVHNTWPQATAGEGAAAPAAPAAPPADMAAAPAAPAAPHAAPPGEEWGPYVGQTAPEEAAREAGAPLGPRPPSTPPPWWSVADPPEWWQTLAPEEGPPPSWERPREDRVKSFTGIAFGLGSPHHPRGSLEVMSKILHGL